MDRQVFIVTDASPVIASDVGSRGGEDVGGGFGSRLAQGGFRTISLSAEGLRDQVTNLLEVVQYVFAQATDRPTLALDQIELSVEISSEGQISILGTGGKAGGRGAIKLTFKRAAKPETKSGNAAAVLEPGAKS